MSAVTIRRVGNRYLMWKSHYDEEMPAQLFPTVKQDEFRASMQRINSGLVIPDNLRHAYQGCVVLLVVCFLVLFLIPIAAGLSLVVSSAPIAMIGLCFCVCGLACIRARVISWYRIRLGALLAQENQLYAGRVPPVRWVGEEYSVITSISVSRSGARANRETFFDIVVEVGQNIQQGVTVIHQHVYAAPGSPVGGAVPMLPYGQQAQSPHYGQQQQMPPQYGYGQQQPGPQYGHPQYGQPQYGQPQYGQPQYGQQPQFMQHNAPWNPAAMMQQPQQPQPQQQPPQEPQHTASEGISSSLLDSAAASDD